MATRQATAAPTLERSGTHAREELSVRRAEKLNARQRGILWAVLAALCLALWALVIVGVALVLWKKLLERRVTLDELRQALDAFVVLVEEPEAAEATLRRLAGP